MGETTCAAHDLVLAALERIERKLDGFLASAQDQQRQLDAVIGRVAALEEQHKAWVESKRQRLRWVVGAATPLVASAVYAVWHFVLVLIELAKQGGK